MEHLSHTGSCRSPEEGAVPFLQLQILCTACELTTFQPYPLSELRGDGVTEVPKALKDSMRGDRPGPTAKQDTS